MVVFGFVLYLVYMFCGIFFNFKERIMGSKRTRETCRLLWLQADKLKHRLHGLTATGTSLIFALAGQCTLTIFIFRTWWGCGEVGNTLGGWETHTHAHTPPHLNCPFTAFAAHPTHYCPLLLRAQRSVIHPCGALTFRFLSASHSHTAALGLRCPASCRMEEWSRSTQKQHSGAERILFQPDTPSHEPGPFKWKYCHFIDQVQVEYEFV